MSKTRFGHGLILGKFFPPHKGHLFLIEESVKQCDRLTVVIGSLKSEAIDGRIRYDWLIQLCSCISKNIEVIHLTDENPSFPEDHPDFWEIWCHSLNRILKNPVDAVFSSESYGDRLAQILDAKHVMIDLNRSRISISATSIRNNPYQTRQFLPGVVKPHFAKKIVITGPESTGKTTLAEKLAEEFQTVWAHEYAREYFDSIGRFVEPQDFHEIYRGQSALEKKMRSECNGVFFCDTDLLVTKIYSYYYANYCPESILKAVEQDPPDYSILLDIDVEWVEDWQRTAPDERQQFKHKFIDEHERYSRPYTIVSGNYDQRFEKSVKIVREVLSWPFGYNKKIINY